MTDQELIQQFQTGEEYAFDELVKRHYQTTYQFFSRMLKDPMEADDLCQETYIRVYKGLNGFRMQSEFTTWLYRISANVANNYFRKRRVRNIFTSGEHIEEVSADPAQEDRKLDECTWHAIRNLPKKQRMVLMLRIFQELPFKEVAAIMDISENSAKVNYHYAINNLKKRLGEQS
ncbi:MAG: sigma-70 family RNA polymerase sigma factor [Candidatus Marinimicrobia bacterium]|nr:sigma-70 family RNA polymerase sigma factor [Candidatus Neomarinimicrobiota bacterium]MDP6593481.1 sigma-70 family RNA polymerase sigma factor [Candidatus Neomarinimicrobiota bacterium]MDP6837206.1 sigma-70 family RNA polymerase sigma factor [Candidatus Neomarinimicrobiota bacterium]MDP6966221.1 sigma-70 family RNA polymerase sigma factor [Candidatus Neomarinimicrobiota bacterium]